jgi:hypothetical protein
VAARAGLLTLLGYEAPISAPVVTAITHEAALAIAANGGAGTVEIADAAVRAERGVDAAKSSPFHARSAAATLSGRGTPFGVRTAPISLAALRKDGLKLRTSNCARTDFTRTHPTRTAYRLSATRETMRPMN